MSLTWTEIAEMDPSLSTLGEAARAIILGDCYAMLTPGQWGTYLDLAVKYLAAHTGALILRGGGLGATGPVTSESLGDASRSYAVGSVMASATDLDATIWGKRFKLLARGVLPFAFVA